MVVLSKQFQPVKDTVRAKESDHAQAKDGGGERHLLAGQQGGFNYISYIKFDPNWGGVNKIVRADLVLFTEEDAHVGWPNPNSGVKVSRLAQNFPDPNDAEPEGEFLSRYPVIPKDPDSAASGTAEAGEAHLSRVVITGLVEDMAPKSVRRRNGKPGGSKTHHGFAIERRTTAAQGNPRMCVGGMKHADTGKRPYIELFYEPSKSDNAVVPTAPDGPIFDVLGSNFEATFERGANQPADAAPATWHIQLFKGSETDAIWSYDAAASPSDVQALTCTVPLSLVATTGSRYRFVSGIAYEWRLRVRDNKGDLSPWSDRLSFGIDTSPPDLSNLRPGLTPTLDTLNNVFFRADYSDVDGSPLLRYQVQVRTQTSPTDPAWADDLLWDSGPIDGTGFAPRTPGQATEIKQPYGGVGLTIGLYSWRMRAWDVLNAPSAWVYSDFELTKGWEPEPGEVELLTGYVNRRLKARILIKGLRNDKQLLVKTGNPDSGRFKLTYDGETTAFIHHDDSASEVKDALTALPNISASEVAVTKKGDTWTVKFDAEPGNRPLLTAGSYENFDYPNERVDVYSDRAPGTPVAVIEDAANIGASEMYNAGGEFFFSIPSIHPQASVILPYQTHYALEVFRGESWREIAAGYITDYDATADDVVFYGQDYMAILARQVDERFNKRASADAQAKLWPETGGGSKYVDRTIKQIIQDQLDRSIHDVGSPLAFFTRAAVPAMGTTIDIFTAFKERLPFIAGLIESWRAGRGIRTRIHAQRRAEGAYEWKVRGEPGKDRLNLRMEYGGLVQGFRIIPYGDFATRLNAIGRLYNSSMLEYKIARAPHPTGQDRSWYEERYGRFAKAVTYGDISDAGDLERRAKQQITRLTREGKALALNLRPGSFSIKDGWDICDSVPVDIKRGIVDTSKMGSGLWTIWGWTWELKPNGQEIITLSVLPKEDPHFDEDDIPRQPTPDPTVPGDDGGGGGDNPPGNDDEGPGGGGPPPPPTHDPTAAVIRICVTHGNELTTDRPIEMDVCDGADVAGRDLIIQLSVDDPTTEGPELGLPIASRYMGEVADYHPWSFSDISPGLGFMLYEAIGPTNCGVGCGGCTAPATRWSGWTHREGWFSFTVPAPPDGAKALRVNVGDLFGSNIGAAATQPFGVRFSATPPDNEKDGLLLGVFTWPVNAYMDIPIESIPETGILQAWLGVTPEWSANRGATACQLQEPAQTGTETSGRAQYQPITFSSKWVYGTPSAVDTWKATVEAALPGAELIEDASASIAGLLHLVFRYHIHEGDFPATGAILTLDPPGPDAVPIPDPDETPPWDIPVPPEPPFPDDPLPEPPPEWQQGLGPVPDDLTVRWIIALYEGITDIGANGVVATGTADAPLFVPDWVPATQAVWLLSHSTLGVVGTVPAGYGTLATEIAGDAETTLAERLAPLPPAFIDSQPFDPPPFGVGGTNNITANIVLGHLPYNGQAFEGAVVGYGDGLTTTFKGFPTVKGTAVWFVDGILVKPASYDDATGEVVFDRAPAYGAAITQNGTKAKET